MLIAIGALKTRGPLGFLRFARHARRAMRQAKTAEGCLFAEANRTDGLFFSLTAWEDEAALLAFSRSGDHLEAMRAMGRIGENRGFHRYHSDAPPAWTDALNRWRQAQK
ncbi:MAG: antibiotic biosynthesis monooxygenase [Pseudomonadota bacterium]